MILHPLPASTIRRQNVASVTTDMQQRVGIRALIGLTVLHRRFLPLGRYQLKVNRIYSIIHDVQFIMEGI